MTLRLESQIYSFGVAFISSSIISVILGLIVLKSRGFVIFRGIDKSVGFLGVHATSCSCQAIFRRFASKYLQADACTLHAIISNS